MTVSKITTPPTQKELIDKTNEIIDNLGGGGGSSTDVQINGTSITSQGVANIVTNSAYDSSSNKIATMSDVPTVDQTYNASSTNAQSGVAINGARFIQNATTLTNSIAIGSDVSMGAVASIAIGANSVVEDTSSIVIGGSATALGKRGIAIGRAAQSGTDEAYQLGYGYNNAAQSFAVGFYNNGNTVNYQLLNGTTGKIPNERLNLPSIHNLFDFKWVDHELTDQSWLKADTFSWQSGTTYSEAYNHLVDDIDNITAQTETIGSYTVTFCRATDGHKVCLADQEGIVNSIYAESGISWYYILDTTNTRFKLPRTKFGFEGLRNTVGDKIDAGLPNIASEDITISLLQNNISDLTSGPLKRTKGSNASIKGSSSGLAAYYLSFDASLANPIYGNSTTVQEPATQMYLYFYVGGFTETATQQTAGLNASLFNNKADLTAVDGQWVGKYLYFSGSAAIGSYSYSLTDYLPSDYTTTNYLVYGRFGLASSNSTVATIGRVASPRTNLTDDGYCFTLQTTSNGNRNYSAFIMPVGITYNNLYYQIADAAASVGIYINLYGYRRLGTNP